LSPAKGLTKTGRIAAAALASPHRRVAGKEMHERELEERKKKEMVKRAAAACGARSRALAGSAEAAVQAGGAVAQTLLAGGSGRRGRGLAGSAEQVGAGASW